MLAHEIFDGPHVCHNKRTLAQNCRTSRARLAGKAIEPSTSID